MNTPFQGFDLSDFWEESDYARKEYIDNPLTGGKVTAVEEQLGYKLSAPVQY